jgi:hypothetical protein
MDSLVNQVQEYENKKQNIVNDIRNGRVDIMKPIKRTKHLNLYKENNDGVTDYNIGALAPIYSANNIQFAFLSKENVNHIQELIKYNVYIQSGKKHIVAKQDNNQLLIIMKSIYLQFAENLKDDLKSQLKRLNGFVLDYAIPNILINIEQHLYYRKDVSRIPKPLEHPKYISTAGTRTNPNYIY